MPSSRSPSPEALFEHAAFVRSVARVVLHGDDLVDDVVQDTMLTALEKPEGRRGPLRAWLAGVARNKARNLMRQRAASRRREERVAQATPVAVDGVDELAARAEQGRRLIAAVLSLDDAYRRPILLRYYEGLPPRDVARRLDMPVETVRTRVRRGLVKLRAELEQSHDKQSGGWRGALLALLEPPFDGSGAGPTLLAGGSVVGKKAVLLAALLLVLVGGGLWLRPWEATRGVDERGDPALLASDEGEDGPHLRGSGADGADLARLGTPVDLTKVDRDRDLHGRVVRADGSPVAGASVRALRYPWRSLGMLTTYDRLLGSSEGPSAVTAPDGSFTLRLERGDCVHLEVTAPGLAARELTFLQAGERIRVLLDEGVRVIVVATDPHGEPVRGMAMRLFVNPARAGHWLDEMRTTGPDGKAIFDRLPGGLKGWIDPQPRREGLGDPGWVVVELPSSGELVHRLALPAGRTLRGRVTNTATGEAIEGARVSPSWVLLPSVLTNADGEYVLHGWTGTYGDRLHAVAPGFAQGSVEVADAGEPELQLHPGRTLYGRVVDEGREPVSGALVGVRALDSRRAPTPRLGGDVTDAEGRFAVSGLASSANLLVVAKPGFGRLVRDVGALIEPDLGDLVLPPPCEVSGTLTSLDGDPLARVPVTLTPRADRDGCLRRFERWSDDLGRFLFPDLARGSYRLDVGPRTEPLMRRTVELTAENPVVDLALSPATRRSLAIRVVDEAGSPAAGVYLQARASEPDDSKQGTTGDDGLLELELEPRPYELRVLPIVGLGFALPAPVQVGASQARVELVLARLTAIRGRLLAPEGDVVVGGALRVEGDGDRTRWVHSDESGSFTAYVSPGARVALVFDGLVQGRRGDVTYLPCRVRVEDVAAGTEDLVLRALPIKTDQELTVQVLDPAGAPVEDLVLQVVVPPRESQQAVTGSDGRAHWSGLPGRPLSVMLSTWRPTREQPWLLPRFKRATPGGEEVVALFRAGVSVEGLVLAEDGAPRAWILVHILLDGDAVSGAVSGEDGRFVAVLDPAWEGTVGLRCEDNLPGGSGGVAVVEDARAIEGPVTLRLESAGD